MHPEVFQYPVHHAEVGEDDLEEQHDRRHRQHQREDEESPENVVFLEVAEQEQGDQQRQDQNARQGDAEKLERVLCGELEGRAFQHIPIVFQSHEFRGAHALGEGHFHGDPERDHEERAQAHEGGQREEEAGDGVLRAEGKVVYLFHNYLLFLYVFKALMKLS